MSIFRSIHKIGPLHNKLLLIISEFAFRGLGSLLCLVLCRCMSLLYSKICDRDLGRLSFTNSYTKCCIYISRKSLNFIILRCIKVAMKHHYILLPLWPVWLFSVQLLQYKSRLSSRPNAFGFWQMRLHLCSKHSNAFRTFLNWLKNSKRVWHEPKLHISRLPLFANFDL